MGRRERHGGPAAVLRPFATRAALAIFAAMLALATFVSAFAVMQLHDHECIGEGCPICLVLESAQTVLSGAADSVFNGGFAAIAFLTMLPVVLVGLAIRADLTPVTRCDRLLI